MATVISTGEKEKTAPAGNSDFLDRLKESPIVAIIRRPKIDPWICVDVLVQAGVRFVEITMESEGAESFLAQAQDRNERRICVGAGTVTSPEVAKRAIRAGAKFLVTPAFSPDTVAVSRDNGIPICCGAMTPTEIFAAYSAGADVVKVFPAGTLGPRYIKELRGPFPDIPIVATGGIDAANAVDFFRAGATALGAGGALVPKKGDATSLKQCLETAKELLAAKEKALSENPL